MNKEYSTNNSLPNLRDSIVTIYSKRYDSDIAKVIFNRLVQLAKKSSFNNNESLQALQTFSSICSSFHVQFSVSILNRYLESAPALPNFNPYLLFNAISSGFRRDYFSGENREMLYEMGAFRIFKQLIPHLTQFPLSISLKAMLSNAVVYMLRNSIFYMDIHETLKSLVNQIPSIPELKDILIAEMSFNDESCSRNNIRKCFAKLLLNLNDAYKNGTPPKENSPLNDLSPETLYKLLRAIFKAEPYVIGKDCEQLFFERSIYLSSKLLKYFLLDLIDRVLNYSLNIDFIFDEIAKKTEKRMLVLLQILIDANLIRPPFSRSYETMIGSLVNNFEHYRGHHSKECYNKLLAIKQQYARNCDIESPFEETLDSYFPLEILEHIFNQMSLRTLTTIASCSKLCLNLSRKSIFSRFTYTLEHSTFRSFSAKWSTFISSCKLNKRLIVQEQRTYGMDDMAQLIASKLQSPDQNDIMTGLDLLKYLLDKKLIDPFFSQAFAAVINSLIKIQDMGEAKDLLNKLFQLRYAYPKTESPFTILHEELLTDFCNELDEEGHFKPYPISSNEDWNTHLWKSFFAKKPKVLGNLIYIDFPKKDWIHLTDFNKLLASQKPSEILGYIQSVFQNTRFISEFSFATFLLITYLKSVSSDTLANISETLNEIAPLLLKGISEDHKTQKYTAKTLSILISLNIIQANSPYLQEMTNALLDGIAELSTIKSRLDVCLIDMFKKKLINKDSPIFDTIITKLVSFLNSPNSVACRITSRNILYGILNKEIPLNRLNIERILTYAAQEKDYKMILKICLLHEEDSVVLAHIIHDYSTIAAKSILDGLRSQNNEPLQVNFLVNLISRIITYQYTSVSPYSECCNSIIEEIDRWLKYSSLLNNDQKEIFKEIKLFTQLYRSWGLLEWKSYRSYWLNPNKTYIN